MRRRNHCHRSADRRVRRDAGRRSCPAPILSGMDTTAFDPTAPLPGPPDPWASTSTPEHALRTAVHMTDMIAAEPAIADRILARHEPRRQRSGRAGAASSAGRSALGHPVVVTGCGTSEHAALRGRRDPARGRALGRDPGARALDAPSSRSPPRRSSCRSTRRRAGLVIGISHEGGTTATNAALDAARAAGAPHRHRHRVATAPPARHSPTSSSRPTSSIRAGATRSAISARWSRPPRSGRTSRAARRCGLARSRARR